MPRVPKRWVRNPSDSLAVGKGCTFDEAAGWYVCDFIERFCCQSKGRWAGKPLTLLDWQRDFLMRLFGWRRADGKRRFRRAYLEVAKKNGKSTLVSALTVAFLLVDGEGAPEVYINAYDREQASIVFDEAARMVQASPLLSGRLEVIASKKRIVDHAGNGRLVANSADVPSKDGANASHIIFDELHRQRDRKLWDIFEYAGASREQPLTISITTAGEDESGVWYEQREYSEKVNNGAIPDTTHLGVVYRADMADDIDDPATWKKANPSLGATINADDFARELAEAKEQPVKLANFRRLRLNIICREAAKFIDLSVWDRGDLAELPRTPGQPCWAGADLSNTTDLTALAALFGSAADGFDVAMRFFLPEANIVNLERRDNVPYREWARAGYLTLTPGEVVDYQFLRHAINDLAANCDLRKLLIDPYNAQQLAIELRDADGLPVEFIRQGYLSLSPPTKELARLVQSGKLRHGGHPLLRWNADNAITETDAAGNIKLSKRLARQKIDGLAALVNAVAAATGDEQAPSVYEDRGLLVL